MRDVYLFVLALLVAFSLVTPCHDLHLSKSATLAPLAILEGAKDATLASLGSVAQPHGFPAFLTSKSAKGCQIGGRAVMSLPLLLWYAPWRQPTELLGLSAAPASGWWSAYAA